MNLTGLIMTTAPYNVLENIQVLDDNTVSAQVAVTDSMQYHQGQAGSMSFGNCVRHMAITGSLAAAHVNPVKEKHYYLSVAGDGGLCNEEESWKLIDQDKYKMEAKVKEGVIVESGKIVEVDVSLLTLSHQTIYATSMKYLVVHHKAFLQLFGNNAQDQATHTLPPLSQRKAPNVVLKNMQCIDDTQVISEVPTVHYHQCYGHFDQYFCLPFDALMTSLLDSVYPLLNENESFIVKSFTSNVASILKCGESARAVTTQTGLDEYQIVVIQDDEIQALVVELNFHIIRFDKEKKIILLPKLKSPSNVVSSSIADGTVSIIGMGCKFPGQCNSPNEFWDFLWNKRCGLIDTPADKWNINKYNSEDCALRAGRKCGFLLDDKLFDPIAFGISPKETVAMDPTQRLLLQVTRAALDDSGIRYRGTNTGVFVGSTAAEASGMLAATHSSISQYSLTGTHQCMPANRISNIFDLHGPSLNTDTACSASITALHLAMQSIQSGECDQAVVAGASLILFPEGCISFNKIGAISKRGEIKAFDANSDGTVRGEGIGVIVLKREDFAVRDGDYIYANVCGSAINSNGQGASLTTPSAEMQQKVVNLAYENANLEPSGACYVELHGTGTRVGDSIEGNAAGEIFSKGRSKELGPVRIGSVKTNLGHLEAAAGLASIIKVAMMLDRGYILPSINFETPNPAIQWGKLNLRMQTEVEEIQCSPNNKCYMSISGYGIGGANAHAVLGCKRQTATVQPSGSRTPSSEDCLFLVGGESADAVTKLISLWQQSLDESCTLSEAEKSILMAASAQNYPFRSYGIGCNLSTTTFTSPMRSSISLWSSKTSIVFAFGGQGPQHMKMGKDLYMQSPIFRATIDECDRIWCGMNGSSILEAGLFGTIDNPAFDTNLPIELSIPGLVFVQLGLVEYYKSIGIEPSYVVGHSLGEIASMFASQGITKTQAVGIARSRYLALNSLDNKSTGEQGMIAIGMSKKEILNMFNAMPKHKDSLWIAAENLPNSCTVSGLKSSIQALDEHMGKEVDLSGNFRRQLVVSTAYHTPLIQSAQDVFMESYEKLVQNGPDGSCGSPKIPFISSVTSMLKTDNFTADYCWKNIELPVSFGPALYSLKRECSLTKNLVVVEVSAHPVLRRSIMQCNVVDPNLIVTSMNRTEPSECNHLTKTIGKLFELGVSTIHLGSLRDVVSKPRVHLPAYPYELKQYWNGPTNHDLDREYHPLVNVTKASSSIQSTNCTLVSTQSMPWIKEHNIRGKVLFPAAGFLEAFLELGVERVYDVKFTSALLFSSKSVEIQVKPEARKLKFCSKEINSDKENVHCMAWFVFKSSMPSLPSWFQDDFKTIFNQFDQKVEGTKFYEEIKTSGYEYGPMFQCIKEVHKLQTPPHGQKVKILSCHSLSENLFSQEALNEYKFHPAALDSVVHAALAAIHRRNRLILPSKVHSIWFDQARAALASEFYVHTTICKNSQLSSACDMVCFTVDPLTMEKDVFCVIKDFEFELVDEKPRAIPEWQQEFEPFTLDVEALECTDNKCYVFQWNKGKTELDIVKLCQTVLAETAIEVWIVAIDDSPQSSMAIGFGQTLQNERKCWTVKTIEFEINMTGDDRTSWLKKLQNKPFPQRELKVTKSGRLLCSKWTSCTEFNDSKAPVSQEHEYYGLSFRGIGISNVHLVPEQPQAISQDEIEVKVASVGLNYQDSMMLSGDMTDNLAKFGVEMAGVVTKKGQNVKNLTAGDRVFCMASFGLLHSHIRIKATDIFKIPSELHHISMSELACISGVFLTAWYGLIQRAKLKKGDRVLIHSGAGGLGQAAIQVCQMIGCKIFVTVGTDEKRHHLKALYGVTKFSDSHDLDQWTSDVQEWAPDGVDVVLNSLHGPAIYEGMQLLAHGGYFIEVGKRDILNESPFNMSSLALNINFLSVHVDVALFDPRSKIKYEVWSGLEQICDWIKKGKVRPIATHEYDIKKYSQAFNMMKNSSRIGKVAIKFPSNPLLFACSPNDIPIFSPLKSYLLIGGAGALGLEFALWMASKGVRHIVLTSRSGVKTFEEAQKVEWLRTQKVDVKIIKCDASDDTQMLQLMQKFGTEYPTLGGVMLLTMVLRDGLLEMQLQESFDVVYKAKIDSAETLLQCLDTQVWLEFIIFATSVSSSVGNQGQANYVAANSYLERLASKTLNAMAVAFPFIRDAGIGASAHGKVIERQAIQNGIVPCSSKDLC